MVFPFPSVTLVNLWLLSFCILFSAFAPMWSSKHWQYRNTIPCFQYLYTLQSILSLLFCVVHPSSSRMCYESAMLKEFAVKVWKVSEESRGRDETPRATCHKLSIFSQLFVTLFVWLKHFKTNTSRKRDVVYLDSKCTADFLIHNVTNASD